MNQKYDLIPPSDKFDLSNWKLHELSTAGITKLKKYASPCFFLTSDDLICFDIDTQKEGKSLRSELRHIPNWGIDENRELSATIKLESDVNNFRVTLVQVHGITKLKEFIPPVLRIVMINRSLYSFIKTDFDAVNTEKQLLVKNIDDNFFDLDIKIEKGILKVSIDGTLTLDKDISFWKYDNYFKIGCYPQTNEGHFQVYVKKFQVR